MWINVFSAFSSFFLLDSNYSIETHKLFPVFDIPKQFLTFSSTIMIWGWLISFVAHKLSSVVGEVDPVKETGNESGIAPETTEETESEIEDVTEKEKENDYVIVTETEGREVDTEDNVLLEALIV